MMITILTLLLRMCFNYNRLGRYIGKYNWNDNNNRYNIIIDGLILHSMYILLEFIRVCPSVCLYVCVSVCLSVLRFNDNNDNNKCRCWNVDRCVF